jgi:ATP-dependent DNA ligase
VLGIDRVGRQAWRPQEFGYRRARDIRDPLVEPLWTGLRVLAHVDPDEAHFVDRDGDAVAAARLAQAVSSALLAMSAIFDGYLTTDTQRTDRGARPLVRTPGAGEQTRILFFGRRRQRPEREVLELVAEERAGGLPAITDMTSFVAVDLLELDGEPLLDIPLQERKRLLESVIRQAPTVRVGIHIRPPIDAWMTTWRSMGFRGLTFKGANSRYAPGDLNDEWSISPMPER